MADNTTKREPLMIMVKGAEEQQRLMEILEGKGYHWMSGQQPTDIPRFLRICDGRLIHVIDPSSNTIRFYPAEVQDKKEQRRLLAETPQLAYLDPTSL